jgi:hypothetical protein
MRYYTVISIAYIYIYKQYLLPYNTSFDIYILYIYIYIYIYIYDKPIYLKSVSISLGWTVSKINLYLQFTITHSHEETQYSSSSCIFLVISLCILNLPTMSYHRYYFVSSNPSALSFPLTFEKMWW